MEENPNPYEPPKEYDATRVVTQTAKPGWGLPIVLGIFFLCLLLGRRVLDLLKVLFDMDLYIGE